MKKLTQSKPLTLLLLVLASACVGVLSLWFAAIDNRTAMFLSYFTHPAIAVLNIVPVVFLALLLYFLTGRAGLAYLITAGITAGFTAGNFFKLTFRDDPLMMGDLLLLKEAGNMAGKYQLFLNKSMLLALLLLLLGWVFLHFLARAHMPLWPRLGGVAVLLLVLLPLRWVYQDWNLYTNVCCNEELINPWAATHIYVSKGFLYPFLYSAKEAVEAPPVGYDASRARAILSAYDDADIPEEEKVDIIAIQLEAYNDFTKFGVPELNPSVYAAYHALEAESYTGNLVTNIFAGGTVDTERCFLTGFKDLGAFRSPTNSYAWYLRDQGYVTQGSHSCYQWFYNRLNINRNLGFQDYWFVENYYGALTDDQVGLDDVLFPEMIKLYEAQKAASNAPVFSFNVTYQGHGPYNTDVTWWGDDYVVDRGYTQEERNLLNNYFGSIQDTNDHLTEFFDHFRASSQPVVIVLFGDHNPWMGDGNSIYHLLGIDLDLGTREGFLNYYATRYLIWANDAAKAVLGNDFLGEGPDIGPYFLMNELFRLCGWEGPAFMQATGQLMDQVPVMNVPTGLFLEDGALTETLTPEGKSLLDDYTSLQYYWMKHFAYE